jgi:hypothetical protein
MALSLVVWLPGHQWFPPANPLLRPLVSRRTDELLKTEPVVTWLGPAVVPVAEWAVTAAGHDCCQLLVYASRYRVAVVLPVLLALLQCCSVPLWLLASCYLLCGQLYSVTLWTARLPILAPHRRGK